MIKTVLAPNAPWPYNQPKASKARPKPAISKLGKVRSTPTATDEKFEAWLKTITPIKGKK